MTVDLDEIEQRLSVGHYDAGGGFVGDKVHLTVAERDALVAELRLARAVVKAAHEGHARSECGSCDYGMPQTCTCNPMDTALAAYAEHCWANAQQIETATTKGAGAQVAPDDASPSDEGGH